MADMPPIEISIPENVPAELELIDKEGKRSIGNGREMYAATFAAGWKEYWRSVKTGSIDVNDPNAEPKLVQEHEIEARGRNDGFRKCREVALKRFRTTGTP